MLLSPRRCVPLDGKAAASAASALGGSVFATVVGAGLCVCRLWGPAVISLCAAASLLFALAHAYLTNSSHFTNLMASWTAVILSLAMQLSFGGGSRAAGCLVGGLAGPLIMAIQEPQHLRVAWAQMGLLVVASLAMCVLEVVVGFDTFFTPAVLPSQAVYEVWFWMNVQGPLLIVFVAVTRTVTELTESQLRLTASGSNLENVNSKLQAEKAKLDLQQQLAHSLIFNVFPQKVSLALLELFGRAAEDPTLLRRTKTGARRRSSQLSSLINAARSSSSKDSATSSMATASMAQSSPWRSPSMSLGVVNISHPHERYGRSRLSLSSMSQCTAIVDDLERNLAPQAHPSTFICFADIVGFTAMASKTDPRLLVQYLDTLFGRIDDVCETEEVEKIKTIGDCYMCMGLTEHHAELPSTATRMLAVAQQMHCIIYQTLLDGKRLSFRVGIHVGLVVSGIIGKQKFAYDVWGDTVNTASRLESSGVPGATQVSDAVYRLLPDKRGFVPRVVEAKGKGPLSAHVISANVLGDPSDNSLTMPFSASNVVNRFCSILNDRD